MGRIKTQKIKSAGEEIYSKFGDKFNKNFEENKRAVDGVADIYSKKLRNILAGYLTKRSKKQ